MSLYDYEVSKKLGSGDPPFASFIMAAARKADDHNMMLLESVFPGIIGELRLRYNAPGGELASDRR